MSMAKFCQVWGFFLQFENIFVLFDGFFVFFPGFYIYFGEGKPGSRFVSTHY